VSDPGSCPPRGTTPGDTISAPRSPDVVGPGVVELRLLGYPGAFPCLSVGG
jgi:hypothetical protein